MIETDEEFRKRLKAQSMRDHVFVGDGSYCEMMIAGKTYGNENTGKIHTLMQCGYPRYTHPDE